jgi:hypothetical protein
MIKKILPFVFILFYQFSFAQLKQGEIAIGGTLDDEGRSIIQSRDKGLVIAGDTYSYGAGGSDVYIIKMDSAGNLRWTKTIGGINGDLGSSVIETSDGGLAITGYTNSYGVGGIALYVVKLDSASNLKWTKAIGGIGVDMGYSIIETYDKGLAITGSTTSFGVGGEDVYLVKLDSAGNLKWAKTIGGTNYDWGLSVTQTSDNGLAVVGETYSFGAGGYDVYLIKLDSVGNLKWTKTIGGTGDDWGHSIIETEDKGLAISGETTSFGVGNNDVYIIRLDSVGNLKWTKTIGGKYDDQGYSIKETSDKGFAIAGVTNSFGAGGYDVYIIKIDSTGNLLWTKTIGGTGDDWGFSLIQTSDKGLAIAGMSNSYGMGGYDFYLIKLDSGGNFCNGAVNDSGRVYNGGVTNSGGLVGNGNVLRTGGISGSGGALTNVCSVISSNDNLKQSSQKIEIFPNPSTGQFTLSLSSVSEKCNVEVYNVFGEEVYSSNYSLSTNHYSLDLSADPNGIYLYRVITENGGLVGEGKLIIQK